MANSLKKKLIASKLINSSFKELYPYQQESVEAVFDNEDFGDNLRGQVILPTGAGKTKVMEHLAGAFINEYNSTVKFAVFCHRLMLANNLVERIAKSLINNFKLKKLAIIVLNSGYPSNLEKRFRESGLNVAGKGGNDPNTEISFAKFDNFNANGFKGYIDTCEKEGRHMMFIVLYQSMEKLTNEAYDDFNFDFAFYDEAHTMCATEYFKDNIFQKVTAKSNVNLFFTATPISDQKGKVDIAHDMTNEEFFGKKLIFKMPKDLVEGKYITPINLVLHDLYDKNGKIDSDNVETAIISIQNAFASLEKLILRDSKGNKNNQPVLFVSVRGNEYLKAILNIDNKSRAGAAFKAYRMDNHIDLFITSSFLRGEIDYWDRDDEHDEHNLSKEMFIDIMNGNVEGKPGIDGTRKAIVMNIDQLSEGIDVPNMNGALYLRGCTDAAKFVQFIGRTVRRAPEDRDKIRNKDIKWCDKNSFVKPCSYVYIAQSFQGSSDSESFKNLMIALYEQYGDIIFKGCYKEDLESGNKKLLDNSIADGKLKGKNAKNNKHLPGKAVEVIEQIFELMNHSHDTDEERCEEIIRYYKFWCDNKLAGKVEDFKAKMKKIYNSNKSWPEQATELHEYAIKLANG